MSNEFYNPSGAPSTGSSGSSAVQRAEFVAIAAGFALLPTMLGNGDLPVFVNAGGTALTTVSAASARTKLGLAIGADVQAWDADLDAFAALDATVGILIKTAAATYARRNLVGTNNEITVANGNGVAGNITLSLPAALTFTGKTVTGGAFSGGTFNNVAVTNTSAAIAVNSGGTGATSFNANNVLLGNGNGAILNVSVGNGLAVANGAIQGDINGLTTDATPDGEADFFATYDTSASALKKVALKNATKFKVGNFSIARNSTGTTAVTGLGFKPKLVIFFDGRGDAWTTQWSVGMDDGTAGGRNGMAGSSADNVLIQAGAESIQSYDDPIPSQALTGHIQSLDADGFTVVWTKTGTPGGTLTVTYIAFR